jgi:hypothetical protein
MLSQPSMSYHLIVLSLNFAIFADFKRRQMLGPMLGPRISANKKRGDIKHLASM